MKTPLTANPKTSLPLASSCQRRGMALVITLAIIVLVTMLILAFFSHSQINSRIAFSSVGQARATFVAQSALQNIDGWLTAEIKDSSNSTTSTSNHGNIYLPKTAANILPASVIPSSIAGDSNYLNIIKMSISGSGFWNDSDAPTPVTSVSTSAPSANNRFIAINRWTKPMLFGSGSTISSGFPPPDWILLQRNGVNISGNTSITDASNPNSENYVIGRFAYIIYDVSGLIDINVAGNSLPASGNSVTDLLNNAKRGRLHQINDLTPIGISNVALNQLISWKTGATSISGTNDAGYLYLFSGTSNFITVGDSASQAFTSRQDLISYVTSATSGISFSDPNPLQYLTVFSREINAPSFDFIMSEVIGSDNSGNGSYVNSNQGLSGGTYERSTTAVNNINPNLATVTWQSSGTLQDGTPYTQGTPLLQKRFSLNRLSHVSYNSTCSKSDAYPIYRYFGLYRNNTTGPWTYDHGSPSHILTLDEVAALRPPREPDFFELLKAAIGPGSLGGSDATPAVFNANSGGQGFSGGRYFGWPSSSGNSDYAMYNGNFLHYYRGASSNNTSRDNSKDFQIIQIGANIIDQYDTDSYPTAISFNVSGSNFIAYGIENLPYISAILSGVSITNGNLTISSGENANNPSNATSTLTLTGGFAFKIQNPCYNATVNPSAPNTPTDFQITMSGTCGIGTVINRNYLPPTSWKDLSSSNALSFSTSGSDYRKLLLIPYSSSNTYLNAISKGINSGSSTVPAGSTGIMAALIPNSTVNVQLRYRDANNTYQIAQEIRGISVNVMGLLNNSVTNFTSSLHVIPDPRTDRYGTSITIVGDDFSLTACGQRDNYNSTAFSGDTTRSNVPSTYITNDGNTYGNTDKYMIGYVSDNRKNNAVNDSNVYYADPDGIIRPAAGYYAGNAATNNGRPLTTITQTNPPYVPESRPYILNRAFRSVGELGFAFRGQPWKNLDFFSQYSADAALLDVFTVDDSLIMAGKVNLNTPHSQVIQCLLSGAMQNDASTSSNQLLNSNNALSIANILVQATRNSKICNKAELVTRLSGTLCPPISDSANYMIKERREATVRALAESGQTRTWNLMIDIIAQAGRYKTGETDPAKFIVEGEKRYWLHLAIDRYTGQIIDSILEPVVE